MEDQDWQNIINELTEQIKQISIERAVARADVIKAQGIISRQQEKITKLEEEAADEIDVRRVSSGE